MSKKFLMILILVFIIAITTSCKADKLLEEKIAEFSQISGQNSQDIEEELEEEKDDAITKDRKEEEGREDNINEKAQSESAKNMDQTTENIIKEKTTHEDKSKASDSQAGKGSGSNTPKGSKGSNGEKAVVKTTTTGKEKYELTLTAPFSPGGKATTKTFTSDNSSKAVKYYEEDIIDNKFVISEVTINMLGEELSRKIHSTRDIAGTTSETNTSTSTNTGTGNTSTSTTETLYKNTVKGFTKDGKPYTDTKTSKNPNDTMVYYDVFVVNGKAGFYEVTENMLCEVVSRKEVPAPVKTTFTEKVTGEHETDYGYERVLDGTLEVDKEKVSRKGVKGLVRTIYVEEFLLGVPVDGDFKTIVLKEPVNEIINIGTLVSPGNCGRYFNSEKELNEWANKQVKDSNSKWYQHNYMAATANHDGSKWTLTFFK